MAEVMLLIVFALLLSLGTMLFKERSRSDRLEAIEQRLKENGDVLDISPQEIKLLRDVKLRFKTLDDEIVGSIMRRIDRPETKVTLTTSEEEFIKSTRDSAARLKPKAIDDFWKELKAATKNPERAIAQLAIAEALNNVKGLPPSPQEVAELVKIGIEVKAKGEHDWPPMINLSEAGGYYFKTGSAELSENFSGKLRSAIIPRLIQLIHEYKVDVVEVIGHTDEQAIAPRASNFDVSLMDVARGTKPMSTLIPADNAGLGLARAVAVVRVLLGNKEIQDFRILPLSGAQLIDVNERLTAGGKANVKERRRIEIRLRRLQAPDAAIHQ